MMGSNYNARTYTVLIDELLGHLKKNREEHVAIVEEAQKRFREMAIEKLDTMLKDAKQGNPIKTQLGLTVPTIHTDAFDNAIGLLTMNKEALEKVSNEPPTIEITADEYERFVRNKWEWTERFIASNRRYSGSL